MNQLASQTPPCVWLVGAGPGDAELLTVRAARLIGEAETVFHDALVGADVLALAPPTSRLVNVGKRSGAHSKSQAVINRMLVEAARSGQRVVRLKGGDPSVFGRAAEEIAALAQAGVEVRICPGVTTACAAAAEAGLSLTQRGAARHVAFVTAQTDDQRADEPDWSALSAGGSLVVYMGRAAASHIAERLVAAGRPPDTPVLVATDVARPRARRLHTTLGGLAVTMLAIAPDAPTLLMIGDAFAPTTSVSPAATVLELAAR